MAFERVCHVSCSCNADFRNVLTVLNQNTKFDQCDEHFLIHSGLLAAYCLQQIVEINTIGEIISKLVCDHQHVQKYLTFRVQDDLQQASIPNDMIGTENLD